MATIATRTATTQERQLTCLFSLVTVAPILKGAMNLIVSSAPRSLAWGDRGSRASSRGKSGLAVPRSDGAAGGRPSRFGGKVDEDSLGGCLGCHGRCPCDRDSAWGGEYHAVAALTRQAPPAAAYRPDQRRQLRFHRRTRQCALHAALPGRLLHGARFEQPNRAPHRL